MLSVTSLLVVYCLRMPAKAASAVAGDVSSMGYTCTQALLAVRQAFAVAKRIVELIFTQSKNQVGLYEQ